MKNFDIEQLERKNIYKTPENFFAGMQENVLKQTVHQTPIEETKRTEAKIIPMKTNWIYAAAAALALLLGLGFFIKNFNAASDSAPLVADNTNAIETVATETPVVEELPAQTLIAAETPKPAENIVQDLTFEKTENPRVERQTEKAVVRSFANVTEKPKSVPVKEAKIKREDVDQLLTSFTSSELAEMSKDAEMDVYLDLYN